MNVGERIAAQTIDALKLHPLALALVVVNVLFIAGAGYGLHEIAASAARRDAMLAQLAKDCTVVPK